MNDFEKLTQLHEDFTATWAAFDAARHDADDIITAVRERLRLEQEQTAARVADLERTVKDFNRSESVRRMACVELSKIQKQQFFSTVEEQAAFMELIAQQETALRDLKQIQQNTKIAITGAQEAIQAIRVNILGSQNIDLAPRWIVGLRSEFEKLCEGGADND